jgi:hypothetical protein
VVKAAVGRTMTIAVGGNANASNEAFGKAHMFRRTRVRR